MSENKRMADGVGDAGLLKELESQSYETAS